MVRDSESRKHLPMAQSRKIGFSDATTDWQNYATHRPRYPASTVKLIVDFHRAHSNSLRLAHDAGTGSGVFAPVLSEYFDHVHVSDPTAHSIALARENLSRWYAENWWKGKFTFSTSAAEDSDQLFADGSVDFTSLLECAHWTDAERMVESVAKTLAPNGTLAIVYYHPFPYVVDNPRVDEVVGELMKLCASQMDRSEGDMERTVMQAHAGLDYIPLPENLFIQDVTKRIYINLRGRGDMAFSMLGEGTPKAPSRVGEQHRRYEYSHPEPEADGWRQDVDAAWFRGFMASLQQESKMHLYDSLLESVAKAIEETGKDGRTVTIEWTVAIVLGTKK
nr:methyltransferase gedg [Quercus suber]